MPTNRNKNRMNKKGLALLALLVLSGCPKDILEYKIEKIAQKINACAIALSKDEISEDRYVEMVDSLYVIYESTCASYDSLFEKQK